MFTLDSYESFLRSLANKRYFAKKVLKEKGTLLRRMIFTDPVTKLLDNGKEKVFTGHYEEVKRQREKKRTRGQMANDRSFRSNKGAVYGGGNGKKEADDGLPLSDGSDEEDDEEDEEDNVEEDNDEKSGDNNAFTFSSAYICFHIFVAGGVSSRSQSGHSRDHYQVQTSSRFSDSGHSQQHSRDHHPVVQTSSRSSDFGHSQSGHSRDHYQVQTSSRSDSGHSQQHSRDHHPVVQTFSRSQSG